MADMASLVSAVRLELGDQLESFRESFRGTGTKTDFNLPTRNIAGALRVFIVTGDDDTIDLVEDTDYTVNRVEGIIYFTEPTASSPTRRSSTSLRPGWASTSRGGRYRVDTGTATGSSGTPGSRWRWRTFLGRRKSSSP
jgi:hypothetical protein